MTTLLSLPTPDRDRIEHLPLDQVTPDPGQPRKTFDEKELADLAASIGGNGLIQPISVRQVSAKAYHVIAGERRYRAHLILKAPTIAAIIREPAAIGEVRVLQIIENDQRKDVSPLEEARSFQALMDSEGWTVDELAKRIGRAPWRITERTNLLKLAPDFQQLLQTGNLTQSQATELVRLQTPAAQRALFQQIKAGRCATYADLRAASTALVEAEAQIALFGEEPPTATEAERRQARTFKARVEQLAAMLRDGISENEIAAVRKVNPNDADGLADLLALMQTDIRRIEVGLRKASAQASLLSAAAD